MTGPARLVRLVLALAALLAVSACKQGEGDRCETEDDCASGLICNGSLQVCQSALEGDANLVPPADANDPNAVPDAEVPDAEVPDAAGFDAAEDATVDAT